MGDIQPVVKGKSGSLTCGDWTILSELDPAKAAQLKVVSADGSASFTLRDESSGASVLMEAFDGQERIHSYGDG